MNQEEEAEAISRVHQRLAAAVVDRARSVASVNADKATVLALLGEATAVETESRAFKWSESETDPVKLVRQLDRMWALDALIKSASSAR